MYTVINAACSIYKTFDSEPEAVDYYETITDPHQQDGLRIDYEDDNTYPITVWPV